MSTKMEIKLFNHNTYIFNFNIQTFKLMTVVLLTPRFARDFDIVASLKLITNITLEINVIRKVIESVKIE